MGAGNCGSFKWEGRESGKQFSYREFGQVLIKFLELTEVSPKNIPRLVSLAEEAESEAESRMARKRKSDDATQSKVAGESAKAAPPVAENRRVTRSSAKAVAMGVDASGPVVLPSVKPKKREKKTKKESVKEKEEEAEHSKGLEVADAPVEEFGLSKTIIIEHCKQCQSFKKRAELVKDGLEKVVPGIVVKVNPEKPRKGCFEIREEGGEKFVSLLDMPRPFTKMKALDLDKVISDIIVKIK